MTFSITAPAHPHAIRVAVYPALFTLFVFVLLFVPPLLFLPLLLLSAILISRFYFPSFCLEVCLRKILSLHRNVKNRKNKNMARIYIHQGSGPCFWKCKIHIFVAVLEFSVQEIIFSKSIVGGLYPQKKDRNNSKNTLDTRFLRANDAVGWT